MKVDRVGHPRTIGKNMRLVDPTFRVIGYSRGRIVAVRGLGIQLYGKPILGKSKRKKAMRAKAWEEARAKRKDLYDFIKKEGLVRVLPAEALGNQFRDEARGLDKPWFLVPPGTPPDLASVTAAILREAKPPNTPFYKGINLASQKSPKSPE